MRAIILLFLLGMHLKLCAQEETNIRKRVLHKNVIGKEFIFKGEGNNETQLKYLGSIRTKKGETLKFLNSIYVFGLYEDSKRATCQILVYDGANKYLGSYNVGGIWYLPDRLEKAKLIFLPHKECDQTTAISFENGVPPQIYILCKGKEGDVFTFAGN